MRAGGNNMPEETARQHEGYHHNCIKERKIDRLEWQQNQLLETLPELKEDISNLEDKIDDLSNGELARAIQKQNEQFFEEMVENKRVYQDMLVSKQEYESEVRTQEGQIKIVKWKALVALLGTGLVGYLLRLIEMMVGG